MSLDFKELRARLAIDRDSLDEELVHQAELYYHAAREHARSVAERDDAKDELKRKSSELSLRFRDEPGEKKPTEGQIAARVETAQEYLDARTALSAAQANVDIWSALKESYHQRGYMLRELCGLYVAGYYASTTVRGEAPRAVERQAHDATVKRMSERRRVGSGEEA